MPTPENIARLNALIEGLSPSERERLDGAVLSLIGTVKTNGSVGLAALVIAASRTIEELSRAIVRSEIGEAVLAFHTPPKEDATDVVAEFTAREALREATS